MKNNIYSLFILFYFFQFFYLWIFFFYLIICFQTLYFKLHSRDLYYRPSSKVCTLLVSRGSLSPSYTRARWKVWVKENWNRRVCRSNRAQRLTSFQRFFFFLFFSSISICTCLLSKVFSKNKIIKIKKKLI